MAISVADLERLPPEQLSQLVQQQPRDATWAPTAEAEVRAEYGQIASATLSRVVCGTTICEIEVRTSAESDPNVASDTLAALSGGRVGDGLSRRGFAVGGPVIFRGDEQVPGRIVVTRYVLRKT